MRNLGGVIPSHLRERAATLAVLDRSLDECLPADCRAHCHVAAVQDATLVLVTDSPAWRSRLHFLSTTIIGHLNRLDNLTLEKVRIHVRQPVATTRAAPSRPPRSRPPAETARALDGLAAEVDEPVLAAALRRLAAHGQS